MKAIVHRTYGSPDVLACEDVAAPAPRDDEVLIRVKAASVNPLDWHFIRGTPYLMRLASGLRAPTSPRCGADVAGRVESVGRNVTGLAVGDEVFGTARGSFAEFVCATPRTLARKPASVSYEQAAAAPIAGVTALAALRDLGRVRAGETVLINGASGGVGTFAVQIAKSFGADVTGVCSARNLELVRSIGADHAIDYAHEDFTARAGAFDVIVDNVGGQPLLACRRALTRGGRYVMIGGPSGKWIKPFDRIIRAAVLSKLSGRQMGVLMVKAAATDFAALGEMLASGTIKAVIDRRYSLSDVPAAVRYLEEGHARGKVIVEIT